MRFTVRELVYIGVFGALWGAIETGAGSLLHVVNVPFSGALLTAVGLAIALAGRRFVPKRGSVLFIGIVTALLKMLSLGGIVINPMIAILAESLLAEIVLSLVGRPGRVSFVLAGILGTLWTLVHPFFTQCLLGGQQVAVIYTRTIDNGARVLHLSSTAVLLVLAALIGVHMLLGAAGGFLGWDLGRVAQARRVVEAPA